MSSPDGEDKKRDAEEEDEGDYVPLDERSEAERHQQRLLAAYPRVSARNMLNIIDEENRRRASEDKARRDQAKRRFAEAFQSSAAASAPGPVPDPSGELRTGPMGVEGDDDDAFNRLCESFDHLRLMTVLTARLVRHYEREAAQNRIVPNLQQIMEAATMAGQGDEKMSPGEIRYMGVEAMLDEVARVAHLRREHAQQTFITEFRIACAPLIYGDDWETHKLRFMAKNKLTRIDRMVLCMAPRRFGKTWAIAWYCLAFIMVVEKMRIAIFSQNQRTSAAICETLHQWLFRLPGGRDRSCSDAKTRVSVITDEALSECRMQKDKTKHPSKSTITALPCSVNGIVARPPAATPHTTPLSTLPALSLRCRLRVVPHCTNSSSK